MRHDGNVKLQARVRVRLVIDVYPGDTWGVDCPMEQVYKQGQRSAEALVAKLLEPEGQRVHLVGKPEIEAVIRPKGGS